MLKVEPANLKFVFLAIMVTRLNALTNTAHTNQVIFHFFNSELYKIESCIKVKLWMPSLPRD